MFHRVLNTPMKERGQYPNIERKIVSRYWPTAGYWVKQRTSNSVCMFLIFVYLNSKHAADPHVTNFYLF